MAKLAELAWGQLPRIRAVHGCWPALWLAVRPVTQRRRFLPSFGGGGAGCGVSSGELGTMGRGPGARGSRGEKWAWALGASEGPPELREKHMGPLIRSPSALRQVPCHPEPRP